MFCVGWRYSLQVQSAHGPFPMRSSAPKLERRNINRPKVREFLAIHGVMQATNTSAASTTPVMEGLSRFARRYHAHNPAAGRNASREVLVRPAIPHSSPNCSHEVNPFLSSRSRVSQKMRASSSRSEEHTSELQSPDHLVCRLLLEKKKKHMCHHPVLRTFACRRILDA